MAYEKYGSDIIIDMMRAYKIPYISLNPGATYRGLHDSLVNYGKNEMPIITCCHEEVAVQIAHGYAKASGRPMVAIVHNVVGLLHSSMAIFHAYQDRVPVMIMGGHGSDGYHSQATSGRLVPYGQHSGKCRPGLRQVG